MPGSPRKGRISVAVSLKTTRPPEAPVISEH